MSAPIATQAAPQAMLSRAATRRMALIVACALFMQNLDGTVISTALPAMARAFGQDPVHMNLAMTSYLISLSAFIPASGWVADRFGAQRIFRLAILIFTGASVLCGRADTLWFLVAARILQGLGGAMMLPVGRLLLLRSVPKSELVGAMAWLTVPALIGPVIGPPLGGMLVDYASWRWIFDINVPIGLLGIALVTRFIPDQREARPPALDSTGLLLSGAAMAGVMFGFETVGRGVLPVWATTSLLGGGTLSGILYAMHSRVTPSPLIDLSLLRIPTFGLSVLAGSLFRIGIGAIPFLLPLMLQLGFGDSAAQSGLITLASSAGALVMKPAAQYALRRFGFRQTLVWNGLVAAGLIGICAAFRPAWPIVAIYAALLTGGFFRSLQFTAFNTIAYGDIPTPRMSAATSLYATLQQISLTLGITVGAASLEGSMAWHGHAAPMVGDFSLAFIVVAAVSFLAPPICAALPHDAGDEMSGHHARAGHDED